jgi:hypothetical protein
VQRALPVVLLLSLSCTLTETQAATIPTPKWMWDVEMTRPLLDGQNTAILSLPMPHYACTKEPEKIYAPGANVLGGFDCTAGPDCETCKDLCIRFDFGGNSQAPRSAACTTESVTGLDHFPANCFPRLQGLEGQFSPMATWFDHLLAPQGNSTIGEAVGPDHPDAPSDEFVLKLSFRWAIVDVYGSRSTTFTEASVWEWDPYVYGAIESEENFLDEESSSSHWEVPLDGKPYCGGSSGIPCVSKLVFAWSGSELEKIRTVNLVGTFRQIQAAMKTMTFKPERTQEGVNMNSYRVRHAFLSPTTTRLQPWFQVEYRIQAVTPSEEISAELLADLIDDSIIPPTYTQQVWVVPVNDAPAITDPQEGYLPGCITSTPCVDNPYSIFETNGPNYHFGQYWRWEGTSDPVMIKGLSISDPDLDEGCIFETAKPCKFLVDPAKAYYCGKVDFNARVLIGTIALNTIDDLEFYDNSGSAKGFTSQLRYVSQAIKSVTYRVDTPENVARGQSAVSNLNTQYEGAPSEYLFIRLSDQGSTGANGFAQSARDKNGDEGLKIDIQIAAINDAPTLSTPTGCPRAYLHLAMTPRTRIPIVICTLLFCLLSFQYYDVTIPHWQISQFMRTSRSILRAWVSLLQFVACRSSVLR